MNHRAIEEALDANSPRAGFFIKLRGRAVQAQLSLDKSDHLGKAKSSSLAQTRCPVLLSNWLGVGRSCKLIRRRDEQRRRDKEAKLKERSDVH